MKICPVGTERFTDGQIWRSEQALFVISANVSNEAAWSNLQYYLGVYPEVLKKRFKTCEDSGLQEKKIRIWDHLIRSKNVKNATAMIRSTILKIQFAVSNFIVHGLPIRRQWPPRSGIRASVPVLFCGEHHSDGEEVKTQCAETYVRTNLITVLFTKYY